MDNQPRETSASLGFAWTPGNCTGEGLPTVSELVLLLCSWHPLLLPAGLATERGRRKFNVCCLCFKRLKNSVNCAASSAGQMEHSSADPGAFSPGRSPRMSTSCGSCAPAISTSTKRGRCCASRWPGASSTRWISSCSPGDPQPCCRSTTLAGGTTRTKVRSWSWHLTHGLGC